MDHLDLVSIVMLSYNRKIDVEEGLQELLKQNYKNIEIIVVDNGSADGTPEMINEKYPQVKLVALGKNIGVAAYNKGFQQSQGKYIVVLDDDSFPEINAIPRMVEEFKQNEKIGVVAFDVRNYYDYKKTNLSYEINHLKDKCEKNNIRYQMAFNGAGVGIRKKCIDELGGYPEEFFLYWNEQDLSIRILNAGYQIRWFPDIISLHKYSPSNRESWRAPFYYTRNLYWITWKYFPLRKCLKDTIKLLYYCWYYSFEQRTTIYLKATITALFKIRRIKRTPADKQIIENLRLTFRLPFVYYK
jgi:GT2 family glycosyltransferase